MNGEPCGVAAVGCGMSVLSAVLRATKRCHSDRAREITLEEQCGGHTRFTKSFRIPAADIDFDAEFDVADYLSADFYSDIMSVTNDLADVDVAERLVGEAAEMFEWLTAYGVDR